MPQVSLSGNLSDVTGHAIDDISGITVKASHAVPTSAGVTTSRPRDIPITSNGNFNITLETGVKAWIFIEGDGWSDSVPVLAASGMTELWQAIVNALPSTMTGDLLQAIANALDKISDAEDLVKFDHGPIPASVTSVDELEIGSHGVPSTTIANNLGLPFTQGTLLISRINVGKTVIGIANSAGVQSHEMWVTSINSGVVAPWDKVFPTTGDSMFHGVIPSSTQSITELADGEWGSASTTTANQIGLPGTLGTLKILPIATGKTLMFVAQESGVQKSALFISSISGGVVAPWTEVGAGSGTAITSGGAPGLKTVGVTLTAGSALDGTAGRCRVLAQVTAPVTRWRVHIESRRQVFSSTADFTLGAVSVGRHTSGGNITGTTSLKSGNTNISGSSEWVSRWITNDLSEETLIDFNVSGTGLYSYQAGAYRLDGSTWEPAKEVPAAVWIEVETYAETPVVAMIGDSTGAGQGADRPVHESALHVAARKHRFIPMNYSYPGSTMQSMTNPDHHIYKRWAGLAKPDSVIIQSGSNDIHGGTATGELQTRFSNLAELARGISPVVIGTTVKARYPDSGDFAAALEAHNTYVKTQPAGTRDFLDFYQALSPNGTVEASDAADAAHLTTAGHAKLAAAFDTVTVARKDNASILESVEPRLLGHADTEDAAFAVVDEEGRRTWLEVAPDGGPTDYARSLIGSTGGGDAVDIPDFPTEDWAHWGDSNSDSWYLGTESWTSKLAQLTGKNHYMGGYYNQKSINIAARQGGAPSLVTVAGNVTAASGATEITEAVNPVTSISTIYEVPGTLAGVHGRIKPLADQAQSFTPTTPGVYNIPPRSVFTPDAASMRNRHATIWMGRNDRYDDGAPQQVARSARHMVDYLAPRVKRVLVLQLVPGTEGLNHARIKPINDLLQAEFPSQFVPIAEWMMTDRAAELAGITYTEQDLTDIAEGRIPASFRSDNAHFNGVGCTAIAHFLHEEILKRGWL